MYTEIFIVLVLFGFAWYFLDNSSYIVEDPMDGKNKVTSEQPELTSFSYSCWIRIDKFDYGTPKVIFVKGSADLQHACPALLIDANTNTLLVKMDTYGIQETIAITSVPAKKWLHIALTVQEHELKVYINGIEYANHLSNIPKTNTAQVLVSPDGFSGRIAKLQFFPKVLSYSEVVGQSKSIPSTTELEQVFPPYFDISWFRT
jgi:hypothetical protein